MAFRSIMIIMLVILSGCNTDSSNSGQTDKKSETDEMESACYNDSNRDVIINGVPCHLTIFARLAPVSHAFVIVSKPEIEVHPTAASPMCGVLNGRGEYDPKQYPQYFGKDGRWHGVTCSFRKNGKQLGKFSPENEVLYLLSENGPAYQISFADAGVDGSLLSNWPPMNDKNFERKASEKIKDFRKFELQIRYYIENSAPQPFSEVLNGKYSQMYYEVRPANNKNNCNKNPR